MKKAKIIIWVLIVSCVLNLILAFNAGQKRRSAVGRLDTLNAKLTELTLRYKNAVQSYDALEKRLKEAREELQQQQLFAETLKETLEKEQKKFQALEARFNKTNSKPSAKPSTTKNIVPSTKDKKDRTSGKSW